MEIRERAVLAIAFFGLDFFLFLLFLSRKKKKNHISLCQFSSFKAKYRTISKVNYAIYYTHKPTLI